MTALIVILCLVLVAIVIVQIARATELASKIRGEEEAQRASDYWNSRIGIGLVVLFLIGCIGSALHYQNVMLGYGPHEAASAHGGSLDRLFNITLFFTGIVFVLTHIALFWFAYKYRGQKGRVALFMPHDNRLEMIWTAIPAVVMTFLVVGGLQAWNTVMADVKPNEEVIEIEATGYQFAWAIRYPGVDNKLGTKDYKKISPTNDIGQDWTDNKNWDDFKPTEIVLPVGKKVRVRVTARDVLHNFFLPHFRVKMDAVPGMPTYFVFTPIKTSEEYRQELRKYDEYNEPNDPKEPDGKKRWEAFTYELACAELCGKGHFSMRVPVRVVSEDEYKAWMKEQKPAYSNIRNTDDDPFKGQALPIDPKEEVKPDSTASPKVVATAAPAIPAAAPTPAKK